MEPSSDTVYPPLKLRANAPENRQISPKGTFIFQPLIFRGKLLVSGRVMGWFLILGGMILNGLLNHRTSHLYHIHTYIVTVETVKV